MSSKGSWSKSKGPTSGVPDLVPSLWVEQKDTRDLGLSLAHNACRNLLLLSVSFSLRDPARLSPLSWAHLPQPSLASIPCTELLKSLGEVGVQHPSHKLSLRAALSHAFAGRIYLVLSTSGPSSAHSFGKNKLDTGLQTPGSTIFRQQECYNHMDPGNFIVVTSLCNKESVPHLCPPHKNLYLGDCC